MVLGLYLHASCAAEQTAYARYTWGSLGGKRQMAQDSGHIYYVRGVKDPKTKKQHNELCVVTKAELREQAKSIGNPPEPIGRLKLSGMPEAMAWIAPQTLCVSSGNHLAFVSIGDKKSPRLASELQVASRELQGISELKMVRGALYAAARRQGLLRVDVTDPAEPKVAEVLPLPGFAMSLDVVGNTCVVGNATGLAFVDLSGPKMKLTGTFDTLRRTEIVRLHEGYLVFCSKQYTCVYDLSDTAKPAKLGEASGMDPFYFTHNFALHVTDTHIFTSGGEGGLYIFDWRDRKAPKLLVQYSFWGTKERLTMDKKIQYVRSVGLASKDKDALRYVSPNENNYIINRGMVIDGNHAYMVDWKGKLWGLEFGLGASPHAECVVRP